MKGTFTAIAIVLILSFYFLSTKGDKALHAGNGIEDSILFNPWYTELVRNEEISPAAINYAYEGYLRLKKASLLSNDSLIAFIDFTKPSSKERFYVLDIKNCALIKKSLVAHGKNSGIQYAESFSNKRFSNQSSLGLFLTANTYYGKHGYSLRINGLDEELNTNAMERAVVVHGAAYVSQRYIEKFGRIGRSFGCPALPYEISTRVIDLIKEGSCLFIYHPKIKSYYQ